MYLEVRDVVIVVVSVRGDGVLDSVGSSVEGNGEE